MKEQVCDVCTENVDITINRESRIIQNRHLKKGTNHLKNVFNFAIETIFLMRYISQCIFQFQSLGVSRLKKEHGRGHESIVVIHHAVNQGLIDVRFICEDGKVELEAT